jgi:hypothetical protein
MWLHVHNRVDSLPRPALIFCLLMFAGCVVERGDILPADPQDYTDAAFLTVPDDEYFWLSQPPNRHEPDPPQQQVPKAGMWLKAGLINVESQCYTPKKAAHRIDYPIFPEYADVVPVLIQPGRRYLLNCDDYKAGKFGLTEIGRLQNP